MVKIRHQHEEWTGGVRGKTGSRQEAVAIRPLIDNDLDHSSDCGAGGSGWAWEVKIMRFGDWLDGGLRLLVCQFKELVSDESVL